MTRSRSGSFYCVVEPSWAPLSIAQKAAISTAPPTRTPPPPASTPSSQGTLARQRRMEGRSVEPSPSVEMIASPASRHHHQRSPASSSLSSITNSLRNVVPFQHKERTTMMVAAAATAAAGIVAGRHKYSPARPSPLRRQVNAPEPLCPSALWISQRELLPLYYPSNSSPQSTSSSSRSSSRGGLRRSVLKSTFLAGPMAEKAKMYGLRVAWCVFGDAKEEMARDIFGPVLQEPPAPVQVTIVEQVEVSDEGLDHVFVEHDETVDSDESSSSDSEYSEEEDDTASEESDDLELDDEDQIEREVYAIFREASFVLDKLPEVTPVPTAVAVDELWEVVQV